MSGAINHNTNEIILKLRGYPKKLIPHVDKAAHSFIQRVTATAKQEAPEAETTLKNSIKVKKNGRLNYQAGPNVNYAVPVEKGTKKGAVAPLQSLIDWIKVRRIKPYTKDWTIKDLAFAIQQKTKKDGTPAQPFMEPAFFKHRPQLDDLIQERLARI
jgi:HK97 gp10 family phage protein